MSADFGRAELAKLQSQRDRLQQLLLDTQGLVDSTILAPRLRESLLDAQNALENEAQLTNDHIMSLSNTIDQVESEQTLMSFAAEDFVARGHQLALDVGAQPDIMLDSMPPSPPSTPSIAEIEAARRAVMGPSEEDEQAVTDADHEAAPEFGEKEEIELGSEEGAVSEDEEDTKPEGPQNTSPVLGKRTRGRSPSESDDESQRPSKRQLLDSVASNHEERVPTVSTEPTKEQQHKASETSVIDEMLSIGIVGRPDNDDAEHRANSRVIDTSEEVDAPPEPTQEDYDTGRNCSGCDRPRPDATNLVLTCSHWYCGVCLSFMFKLATGAATPVRCCKSDVSLEATRHMLDEGVAEKYEQRLHELSFKRPVYCTGLCESVILGEEVKEQANQVCQQCGISTCMRCHKSAHEGDCEVEGPMMP